MPICGKSFIHYPTYQALPPSLCACQKDLSTPRIGRFLSRRSFQVLVSRTIGEWRWGAVNCGRRGVIGPKASESGIDHSAELKKRKIVEHIFLLGMRADLSDEREKDMLDFLYTSQYQMRGILAISLGRIADANTGGFTHAVYMRFQKKEDLTKFYDNSYYLGVLRDHVTPYCYV